MQPEQKIVLPFKDKNEAEAMRIALYREKALFKRKLGNEASITISRDYSSCEDFLLVIKKTPKAAGFFILDKDDKVVQTVSFTSEEVNLTCANIPGFEDTEKSSKADEIQELKRFIKMQRESGQTDEEIEAYMLEDVPEYSGGKWKEVYEGK
jgi:hypothetical protein